MCGICGKICFDGKPIEEDLIKEMCRSFSYRGPDDNGTYINNSLSDNGRRVSLGLGHQRLSIIDLSPAGHQPMTNEDGTIWITYNGEVYNFKELRSDLKSKGHTFKSETYTEVILHLYE
jgi:asparagine synthase (glutamine-hydrolysing)